MKKLFTLVVLMAIAIGVKAQNLTATLQQGDIVTPYYGHTAFREAYNAAKDGAVITLSTGLFDYSLTIEKSITIIGAGAFGEDETITYVPGIDIRAENVQVEGLYVNGGMGFTNKSVNAVVRHCYIAWTGADDMINTIIDQCVLGSFGRNGYGTIVKNSVIKKLTNADYMNDALKPVTFINDVIYNQDSFFGITKNIFRNCVIGGGSDNLELSSPGQYYNNVFFRYAEDGSKNAYVLPLTFAAGCVHSGNSVDTFGNLFNGEVNLTAFPNTEARGDDNTKVGPEGGSGFKLYPTIPRIISKSIDRQTDAEGKINVSIQVKAEE